MLSRFTRWRSLVAIAVALFTVAWFVPVYDLSIFSKHGAKHNLSFGWDALGVALSPLFDPQRPTSLSDALEQVFDVASGLTNLVLLPAAAMLLGRRSWGLGRRAESIVWNCAALNLIWIGEFSSLRVGYYLWVSSFVALAIAMRQRRRAPNEHVDAPILSTA